MGDEEKKYFVYLLQSGQRAYIGATVDPKRRLRQHNSMIKGGSCRTCGKGPWKFVCVISGFRSWHEALCFEWRWQYDTKRSRGIKSKKDALPTLMSRERWTSNSPLSKDVPLVVEDDPIQYGLPPEDYVAPQQGFTKPVQKKKKKKYKRLYGTY